MGDLDGLLRQSIALETFHSDDQYGDCSYNTSVSYPARVERRIRMVRTFQGTEAVSTNSVFLDGAVSALLNAHGLDRITLPDGTTPKILAIEDGVDGDGNTIYVEIST